MSAIDRRLSGSDDGEDEHFFDWGSLVRPFFPSFSHYFFFGFLTLLFFLFYFFLSIIIFFSPLLSSVCFGQTKCCICRYNFILPELLLSGLTATEPRCPEYQTSPLDSDVLYNHTRSFHHVHHDTYALASLLASINFVWLRLELDIIVHTYIFKLGAT